jgi:energy-coupling factor transport system substrate-specific component
MKLKTKDIAVFAVMASLMFATKKVMEFLPNIHLLGMFIVTLTVIYRTRALIPIYVYVLLDGIFGGFSAWWIPYLYVWAVLWAMTMLIPRRLPEVARNILYIAVCGLHGFLFGTLYMPVNSLMFGFNLEQSIVWWIQGLPFDLVHGVSNICAGLLIIPMIKILQRLK